MRDNIEIVLRGFLHVFEVCAWPAAFLAIIVLCVYLMRRKQTPATNTERNRNDAPPTRQEG